MAIRSEKSPAKPGFVRRRWTASSITGPERGKAPPVRSAKPSGTSRRSASSLELTGRRFMIDVVADAPGRFNSSVQHSLESMLSLLKPAVFRARFQLHEQWNAEECAAELDRIGQRGSHGVILKARDVTLIAA
jgi:hypothetical protein